MGGYSLGTPSPRPVPGPAHICNAMQQTRLHPCSRPAPDRRPAAVGAGSGGRRCQPPAVQRLRHVGVRIQLRLQRGRLGLSGRGRRGRRLAALLHLCVALPRRVAALSVCRDARDVSGAGRRSAVLHMSSWASSQRVSSGASPCFLAGLTRPRSCACYPAYIHDSRSGPVWRAAGRSPRLDMPQAPTWQ